MYAVDLHEFHNKRYSFQQVSLGSAYSSMAMPVSQILNLMSHSAVLQNNHVTCVQYVLLTEKIDDDDLVLSSLNEFTTTQSSSDDRLLCSAAYAGGHQIE
eukprot:TRINITY_DN8206_c0_g1_i1.p1 TRINITY_DN8206_c0_g1~~TRINITY_DN8206_c0_g1_i1.p1  ORF type:complete len:100 (-),score=7.07 TRINITY_DN8206_c0_g1_i1:1449-1748(-)